MPFITGRHDGRQVIVEVAIVGVSEQVDFVDEVSASFKSVVSAPVRA